MTLKFKRLSKIDNRTKFGVYGWVREAEETLNIGNVPQMISSICILYYTEYDEFSIIGRDVDVSNDKTIITKQNHH